MVLWDWESGVRFFGLDGNCFSERKGGDMIELSLDRLGEALVWQLEMLAAMRRMCAQHEIDGSWIGVKEQRVAELLRNIRRVVKVKGNVLVVKSKG